MGKKAHKPSPTKGMNRAEKFIFQFCMEHPDSITRLDLSRAVAEKLGLPLDGFEYADVAEPKLPPEYKKAIDTAVQEATAIAREKFQDTWRKQKKDQVLNALIKGDEYVLYQFNGVELTAGVAHDILILGYKEGRSAAIMRAYTSWYENAAV